MFGKYFRVVRVRRRVSAKRVKKASDAEYQQNKASAHALALSRLQYFNQFYDYSWKRVSIKNSITRWGSCSRQGNLNFNYRIATLGPELSDYIIVHELCHLGEFNHSRDFWSLVSRAIPNYLELRAELKKKGMEV